MIWETVTINGITPQFVQSIDVDDFPESITLHCVAYTDDISEAKDEINQFREFACNKINQVDLLSGGMDLQIGDGEIVDIVLDEDEFQGAVYYPEPDLEGLNRSGVVLRSGVSTPASDIIEWDITINLLFANLPANTVYKPDYRVYPNIEYTLYNSSEVGGSSTKLPTTVTEYTSGVNNTAWTSPNNVKLKDASLASAYRDTSVVGGSKYLACTGFNFAIASDMVVNRMQVKIKYANNSKPRGKYFKYPYIYMKVIGSGYSVNYSKKFLYSDPSTLKEMIFDTANNTLTLPSALPSFYNSSSFEIDLRANLDRYKTFWVDSIEVILSYIPSAAATEPYNALGKEIGNMTIVEDRDVKLVEVTGNACNLPAWLEVNGVRHYWHYSHDHNSGDTGSDGMETLAFTVSPPSDLIELVSSAHKPYQVAGNTAGDNPGSALEQVKVIYQ